MIKLFISITGIIFLTIGLVQTNNKQWVEIDKSYPVSKVLSLLDDTTQLVRPDTNLANVSIDYGRSLVLTGIIKKEDGGKTQIQSKHFVCTSCHNVKREDPDLSISDPQARLNYVSEVGLPFLPGTTLYGAVNRTSFYNGDYEKKYGELVKPARNNIREAIQLCAVECSQGRKLEPWELESVLAYLWTLELKLEDLDISSEEMNTLNNAINEKGTKQAAAELIKSHYLAASPATFVTPPQDRKKGYGLEGNPANGQLIYDLSCKHCHEKGRYAYFELDDSRFAFKFMNRHIRRYTRYSLYQVSRYGTQPINGKRAYMPNFTLEKMSNQQLEDLRAYIEIRSKRK